jgi:hypothetical protein
MKDIVNREIERDFVYYDLQEWEDYGYGYGDGYGDAYGNGNGNGYGYGYRFGNGKSRIE